MSDAPLLSVRDLHVTYAARGGGVPAVRGVSLEVEKNPDYHVKGRPYLDGVKTFFIPDANTAVNAYIAGQLLLHEVNVESQAEQARHPRADGDEERDLRARGESVGRSHSSPSSMARSSAFRSLSFLAEVCAMWA